MHNVTIQPELSRAIQLWNSAFRNKVVAVSGILFLTAASALWMGPTARVLILAVIAGIGLLAILLRWPAAGLIVLIISAFMVPFTLETGTNASINAPLILTGALFGLLIVSSMQGKCMSWLFEPPGRLLIAFFIVWMLAFLSGNALWDYRITVLSTANLTLIQLGQIALYGLSAAVFLLAYKQLTDLRWLRLVTLAFIAFGVLITLGRVIPAVREAVDVVIVPEAAGGLFNTWFAALIVGQLLFNRRLSNGWRLLYVLTLVALAYSSWFIGRTWATGWLPPAIAILAISWLRSFKLGGVLTFLLLAGVMTQWAFFAERLIPAELAQGTIYRPRVWQEVVEIAAEGNWFLGLGPVNYRFYYQTLYPVVAFGNWIIQNPNINSHNNFVDIFAQTGIVGLLVFAWFLIEVGRRGWGARRQLQRTGSFTEGYVNGALGAFVGVLAGCMIADWFLPFVYNIGFSGFRHSLFSWLFLGGLAAVGIGLDKLEEEATPVL